MAFSEWLKVIFGAIGTFLVPFIKRFLAEGGLALSAAATEVVQMLASTSMSGDDKRKEAFRLIVERLKAKGLNLSTSLINAAIEAAVAKLKVLT
jgi:LL-H family phage holin